MKRNYIPFIAGMSTMLLLVGLVGASLAGETRPPAVPQSGTLNGQVAYGEAGVALLQGTGTCRRCLDYGGRSADPHCADLH